MPGWAIIADDLTGACDTALQFATAGYRSALAIDARSLGRAAIEALAIDTRSRASAPGEAYVQVAQTLRCVRAAGIDAVYKKVDSTLRGNVGSELQALLDERRAEVILLAPAFPAQGRAVLNGELLVGGRPLATTPFVATLPIATSSVVALVSQTTRAPVVAI